jgi:hypothetical protein
MKQTLLKHIVSALTASQNCEASGNQEWSDKWGLVTDRCQALLPSGSGFDTSTQIKELSEAGYLILDTSFHHMDKMGGYDGWTDHTVTVKPHLLFNYTLDISGSDRNGIKEYIGECIQTALDTEYTLDAELELIPVSE